MPHINTVSPGCINNKLMQGEQQKPHDPLSDIPPHCHTRVAAAAWRKKSQCQAFPDEATSTGDGNTKSNRSCVCLV